MKHISDFPVSVFWSLSLALFSLSLFSSLSLTLLSRERGRETLSRSHQIGERGKSLFSLSTLSLSSLLSLSPLSLSLFSLLSRLLSFSLSLSVSLSLSPSLSSLSLSVSLSLSLSLLLCSLEDRMSSWTVPFKTVPFKTECQVENSPSFRNASWDPCALFQSVALRPAVFQHKSMSLRKCISSTWNILTSHSGNPLTSWIRKYVVLH